MKAMTDPNFILLFVDSPQVTARFYSDLLGRPPVEESPTFALFALSSGVMLGFWSKHTAEPTPGAGAGGAEIAFSLSSDQGVMRTFADWQQKGFAILQEPVFMDFGLTFVGLDPDGHRLRVFSPAEPPGSASGEISASA